MSPPNEQWAFIHSLMDKIEKKDNDIEVLRDKYRHAKALLTTQDINTSRVSGRISISRDNISSRRASPRTRKVRSSGSSACHYIVVWLVLKFLSI